MDSAPLRRAVTAARMNVSRVGPVHPAVTTWQVAQARQAEAAGKPRRPRPESTRAARARARARHDPHRQHLPHLVCRARLCANDPTWVFLYRCPCALAGEAGAAHLGGARSWGRADSLAACLGSAVVPLPRPVRGRTRSPHGSMQARSVRLGAAWRTRRGYSTRSLRPLGRRSFGPSLPM